MSSTSEGRMVRVARLHLRIGIGATLSVALVGAAILAAAADPSSAPTANLVTHTKFEQPKNAEKFLAALDNYDRAVQSRVQAQGPEIDLDLRQAEQVLQNERVTLLDQLKDRSDGREVQKFNTTVQSHKSAGTALVGGADDARALAIDYSSRYNTIRTRARSSIDHAWKIFGHVVAGQSLITLNRQIEELGTHSVGLAFVSGSDIESSSVSTAGIEGAITATLVADERGLAKSQGKEWVAAMRADLASLSSTRMSLLQRHDQQRGLADRFALTRTQVNVPSVIRVEEVHRQPPPPPMVEAPLPQVSATPSQPAVPIPTTAPARPTTDGHGAIIGLLGGGVLLLLVVISAMTVRRVVGQARRLVSTTARLTDGDLDARVRVQGISAPPDPPAITFDSMAELPAQADRNEPEHQPQIEATVDDPTEQPKHLPTHDLPSSLPNHRQLFLMLNRALDRAEQANLMVGVYFLKIDDSSNTNDGMGRVLDGQMLEAISQRLQTVASEFGFAARLGGDEFAVVFDRATSLQEIREVGERLVRSFQPPLAVDSGDLAVSTRMGASVFPEHARSTEALLRAADAALFFARMPGCAQLNMYSPDLSAAVSEKFAVEQDLRRALEEGEFELVNQPEFSAEGRDVEVVEPLIRWHEPGGRLAPADEFLTVEDESGLTMDINDWALHSAIATSARWHFGRTLASLLMFHRDR